MALIKYYDNQTSSTSSSTLINYRREYGVDESFVSSVPGEFKIVAILKLCTINLLAL
jgi:hypothetical protein